MSPRRSRATARVAGTVTEPLAPDPADFAAITAEVGSLVRHTRGAVTVGKRRVVQLLEAADTRFPREATSETGRDSTQDVLRRGDALLFALPKDDFRPGDAVEWAGQTWAVVGGLGGSRWGRCGSTRRWACDASARGRGRA